MWAPNIFSISVSKQLDPYFPYRCLIKSNLPGPLP
nr:MAG TPA: hypothetical protein [Crassvirales sp.]